VSDKETIRIWLKKNVAPDQSMSMIEDPPPATRLELNETTASAVMRALERAFPRLRGYGIYPDLGLEIYGDNPLEDRIIDPQQFEKMRKLLESKQFKLYEQT